LFTGIVNHLSAPYDDLVSETRLEPKNAAGWMWLGVVESAQNHAPMLPQIRSTKRPRLILPTWTFFTIGRELTC
jgi:hypothetical protein